MEKKKFGYISLDRAKQERFAPLYFRLLEDDFKDLSAQSILLYTLLRNKLGIAPKMKWRDPKTGNAYVEFSNKEVCELLHLNSINTATKIFRELEDFGLIERKNRGFGQAAMIFVLDIFNEQNTIDDYEFYDLDINDQESQYLGCQNHKNCESRITKNVSLDSQNLGANYKDYKDSYKLSHSFNTKQDLKDSDDSQIADLYERIQTRKNDRLLALQFGYEPTNYHLKDAQFIEMYKFVYLGTNLARYSDLRISLFISDLIIFDELEESDKQNYGRAIIEIMKEVFTSGAKMINITKDKKVDRLEFVRKLLKLDHATVCEILVDLNKRKEFDAVKYPKNYLMSVLWDANINQSSALKLKYTGVSSEINPDNRRS